MQFHNAKGFFFRREVKPAYNILYLFNIYIEAKLIDFDTSTLACDSTIWENPCSIGYMMSSEMYDESTKYEGSPAAVYAMGVVLYDVVFGATGWKLIN